MVFFHLLKCHMLMIFPLIANQQSLTVTFCESALFTFFCLLQSPIKSGWNFVEQGNVIQWNFTNSWQQHKKTYIKVKMKVHSSLFFCNIQSPIKSSWGTSFHREMSSNEILQYVDSRSTQNYNRIDRKISQKLVPFILLFLQVF